MFSHRVGKKEHQSCFIYQPHPFLLISGVDLSFPPSFITVFLSLFLCLANNLFDLSHFSITAAHTFSFTFGFVFLLFFSTSACHERTSSTSCLHQITLFYFSLKFLILSLTTRHKK